MSGFANCPSVTKFAVGMEIAGENEIWRVVFANGIGEALCVPLCSNPRMTKWVHPREMGGYSLDLDSIWVGREYHAPTSITKPRCAVVGVSDGYISYLIDNNKNDTCCVSRDVFLSVWEPLPIAEDKPGKVEPKTAEPWKPKVGEPCERHTTSADYRVVLRALGTTTAWVHYWNQDDLAVGELVPIAQLRPLPPEPPVKVGDYVCIYEDGREYVGTIDAAGHGSLRLCAWSGLSKWFTWNPPGVKFTRLVPESL